MDQVLEKDIDHILEKEVDIPIRVPFFDEDNISETGTF